MKDVAITENTKNSNFLVILLKGTLVALSITLILVLIFAFVLRFVAIPDSAISPVNQIIKCISVLIGCFFALKKHKQMGLITGLLIGIVYTIITFLVFSLLDGQIEFSKVLLNDVFFGAIIGAISGIIAVSLVKN